MHAEAMRGYESLGYQIEVEVAPVAGARSVVCLGRAHHHAARCARLACRAGTMMQERLYRWPWRKHKSGEPALPQRYGELFHVICRGERNSCPMSSCPMARVSSLAATPCEKCQPMPTSIAAAYRVETWKRALQFWRKSPAPQKRPWLKFATTFAVCGETTSRLLPVCGRRLSNYDLISGKVSAAFAPKSDGYSASA